MLKFGSTYLYVKNMAQSVTFYEQLFDMKVSSMNYNRWAQFNLTHSCLALMNQAYDEKRIRSEENLDDVYSEAYLKAYKDFDITYGNNFVVNYFTDDLNKAYERLKKMSIGPLSPIMYLNVARPYHFFTISDPDGNTIEITGNHKEHS